MYMYIYNYVLYIYMCVCACDSTCIPDYTWHSIAISCNILGRLLYVMLSQHSEYIAPTIVSNLILDIPRPSGAPTNSNHEELLCSSALPPPWPPMWNLILRTFHDE